ncbi:MAG: FAD-dependent oxidoreductase [Bacteroidota bacterium]
MNRKYSLQRLQAETFDVCVIGGGATGAGCALDAQLRGLKTALIEKEDFAAETSSKSTKLVHGGVRYLEQAVKKLDWEQFRLVRKALKERKTMLDIAPHLAHPLPLLTPCYSWFEGWYYALGLKIYDWIAGDANLFPSRRLSKKEALQHIPTLNDADLHSAVLYYDGQLDDTRYNVMLAKTASEAGAAVANHLQVLAFAKDKAGRLLSVNVLDQLTGDVFSIKATIFINATGPFSDTIRQMANPRLLPRIRVSKGVHIVLPRELMPGHSALLIPKTDDGRVIFAIPWLNQLLVGTTDTEMRLSDSHGRPSDPVVLAEEVAYLLRYLNRYLTVSAQPGQVQSGFAGMRPLLQANPDADTKELVRDHEVEEEPVSGLLSIMGGKWTTYRLMAQDTVDQAYVSLKKELVSSVTATYSLSGAHGYAPDGWKKLPKVSSLPAEVYQHLWGKYGTHTNLVIALAQENPLLSEPLTEGYPHLKAEVIYAVRYEMASTLRDVLARRLSLEVIDWQATAKAISVTAQLMAEELGWPQAYTAQEVAAYLIKLAHYQGAAC